MRLPGCIRNLTAVLSLYAACLFPLQADVFAKGGQLFVQQGSLTIGGQLIIEAGATLTISQPVDLYASLLEIYAGGRLEGCGTIHAEIYNEGLILSNCGPGNYLVFTDLVVNQATVRAAAASGFTATDAVFTNDGVLDLIFGDGVIPLYLEGPGLLLTENNLPQMSIIADAGSGATLTFDVYPPHVYRVQWAEDQNLSDWNFLNRFDNPVTEPGLKTVFDSWPAGRSKRFYRYQVLESPAP